MHTPVILAAAALVLTGCTNTPDLDRGIVTNTQHQPAWIQFIPICTGQPLRCTQNPIYHPEVWILHLGNGQDRGEHQVDAAEFERCTVGEMYPECGAA